MRNINTHLGQKLSLLVVLFFFFFFIGHNDQCRITLIW